MMQILTVFSLALVAAVSAKSNFYVDLTHTQDDGALGWPTFSAFRLKNVIAEYILKEPKQWLEGNEFTQNEHLGTHMDAPRHFVKNGETIESIGLERLHGPGVVIDVREESDHGDSNYQVSVDDLKKWEKKNGKIPEKAIIFILTGNGDHYRNPKRYYGYQTDEEFASKTTKFLRFPGLGNEAAEWLIKERSIIGTGIDTISMDSGDTGATLDLPTHRTLLGEGIWILENVGKNLKELPPVGFDVAALPYKIGGGSGAPTRVVAYKGNWMSPANGSLFMSGNVFVVMFLAFMTISLH